MNPPAPLLDRQQPSPHDHAEQVASADALGCVSGAARITGRHESLVVSEATVGGSLSPGRARRELTLDLGTFSPIAEWEIDWSASLVADRPDAIDLTIKFELRGKQNAPATVGLDLSFVNWSPEHYVLMPAALYNGNRYPVLRVPYSPRFRPEHTRPDLPTMISDVPRLSIEPGPSRVQQLAGDLATPLVGVFDPHAKRGYLLLTDSSTPLGPTGLEVEESIDRRSAIVRLTAPGVREGVRYWGNMFSRHSDDRGVKFATGQSAVLRARLYAFDCADVPALFRRFCQVRQDLSGPIHLEHRLPFSAAWAIQQAKYNRDNWDESNGLYQTAVRSQSNPIGNWSAGWCGGTLPDYPLMQSATDETTKARAVQSTTTILTRAISPSGFLYGAGNGQAFRADMAQDTNRPWSGNWHLIRRDGDELFMLIKKLILLRDHRDGTNREPPPATWVAAARSMADAFVRLWDRHGQFGQWVDQNTGDVIVGNSAAGALAPGALALASQYFDNNADYLRVALASGNHLYTHFTHAGITTGGPGDALQNPDSESAAALVETFVTLFEVTGERGWLDKAVAAAHQLASWVMSYDFTFPPASLFGRLDMRTAGSVFANVQNKHSAPALCTLSGVGLLRIFRATGDLFFLRLLQEIAHNLPQYLSREDRRVGEMPPGWMNERVNTSDWNEPVGEIFTGSCWCEVSMMLTWAEVPGLYVQPDTGLVCPIDNIDARSIGRSADGQLEVELHNPTPFEAVVRVWSEPSAHCVGPLSQVYLTNAPTLRLAPGERRVERFG